MWYNINGMSMKKSKLIEKIIISVVLFFVFYQLSKYTIDTLNIFLDFTHLLLCIIFTFILIYLLFKFNLKMVFIFYLMMIIVFMFFRKDVAIIDKAYSFDFYLLKWLRIMDNNIVFINIVGNVILFIPLMLFLLYYWNRSYLYNIGIAILVIFLLEWLQAFTKKGIFDIVDVTLNTIGIFVAILIKWICKGVRKWNKNLINRKREKIMSQT